MMNQATIPVYIRFGEIPEDGISRVHRSDAVVREEGGLSVWRAIREGNKYYPIMPDEPNENTIADYFKQVSQDHDKVYLVTGDEMFIEGADREPLLINYVIIKDITWMYQKDDEDDEDSDDKPILDKARQLVSESLDRAKELGLNIFIVTDGASGIHNKDNPAVRSARLAHKQWEEINHIDYEHDWTDVSIEKEVKQDDK